MAVIEYMNVVLGMNHAKFDQSVNQATQKMQTFSNNVGGIGKGIASIGLAGGLAGIATASVKLAADAETAAVQFEVLTGSAESANKILSEMRKLDQESPLGFTDFQQSAKTMLGFGVSANEASERMRQLSMISMGNADRMQQLSLAFSQTTAAGRLMGQEVLQFVNAGFNPLQQISKMTGESMAQLKKRMEEGGVSVQEVGMALDFATGKGGLFFGMNEKIAQTTAGQLAKLQSDFKMLGVELGNSLIPVLKDSVELIRQFTGGDGAAGGTVTFFADGIRAVTALISDGLNLELTQTKKLLNDINEREFQESFKDGAFYKSVMHTRTPEEEAKVKRILEQRAQEKKMQEEVAAKAKALEEQRKIEDAAYQKRLDKQNENLAGLEKQLELEERSLLTKEEQLRAQANSLAYYDKEREKAFEMLKRMEEIKQQREMQQEIDEMAKDMGLKALQKAQGQMAERRETPTAMAGSVEAYKLFLERDNNQAKQVELQTRTNTILDEMKRELANKQLLGVAKR
jgi:tape measure domain-containing protein